MGNFQKYYLFRENTNSLISKIKLGKSEFDSEFQPFLIDKKNHTNLRILLRIFEKSPEVGMGYTVLDKKGETEPRLKKKSIYLTGGSVRDHLKGKTPRNYNLVVDASPSEIEMILNYSGVVKNDKNAKYSYSIIKKDKNGKPIEFLIQINGDIFYLSPLNKSVKSKYHSPEEVDLTTSLEDDAKGRDFTINAMYIPLKNYNGENSELIDVYGGAHHLKNGQIVSIGSFEKRVKEDPVMAHRYVRMESKYGKNKKFPSKYKELTNSLADNSINYKDEFLSGYENDDTDKAKYLNLYNDSGLLKNIYPSCEVQYDTMPQELMGDKFLTSAWLLRNNPNENLKNMSSAGWSQPEIRDIMHLINIYKIYKNNILDDDKSYLNQNCGLPNYKINKWINVI